MNNIDALAVNKRFFHTIDVLIRMRRIRGLRTFTAAHNINYWNMCTIRNSPETRNLPVEYLTWIVQDYNVSAEYLLTGIGCMFNDNKGKTI